MIGRESAVQASVRRRAGRAACVGALVCAALLARPATAHADATAFWGLSTAPVTRSSGGFALGVGVLIIGFEFEYAHTAERTADAAPGVGTGMLNALVQTPTPHAQFYLTAGGGFYHESLNTQTDTGIGTNIGGGIKFALAGPIRIRLDYRVFSLHGARVDTPKRFYAGLNLAF